MVLFIKFVKKNLRDLWKRPEVSDYTPAYRQAGIKDRLHRLEIRKILRNAPPLSGMLHL
jgi:hypothetical protein